MTFKERGITVGDLLLIVIIAVITIFLINKYKKDQRQTDLFINSAEKICYLYSGQLQNGNSI